VATPGIEIGENGGLFDEFLAPLFEGPAGESFDTV
jgi:hypothetical protein